MIIVLKVWVDEIVDFKLVGLERKGRVLLFLLENILYIEFGVMVYFNLLLIEVCVFCVWNCGLCMKIV